MRSKVRYSILAAALIVALVAVTVPAALGWTFFGSGGDPIADSDIVDDGRLRVYLASLNDPEAMLVTLAGEYAVNGTDAFRFERGTDVIVANIDSQVYMTVGGLTVCMGEAFTLTRCESDEAENGLYIYESERDALFAGDLNFSCRSGGLYPVLTIDIEDYLKGVVGYEMSDSFPIEALKAQAVAARTYAMRMRSARVSERYDVMDTTSDQVYKGYISEYENVIRAVDETRGVVGTYNGGYAGCYYTASNGGQISTPDQIWGGDGDYSYIEMKPDAYDLENPRSLVNSYSVPKAYLEGDALYSLLYQKFDGSGHYDARIDGIISIAPVDPKFEDSLMCQGLEFTLTASYRDRGWVETEFDGSLIEGWARGYARFDDKWHIRGVKDWETGEPVVVKLNVYDEIKDSLSLGLNSSDYETVSVTESEDMFTVSMRRFGHGVGMSQRGAQWMAGEHAKTYIEILNFYYPGMALERIDWNTPELPERGELPDAIATEALNIPPVADELPELADGERYATVVLESAGSRLNVRREPSTDSAVLFRLDGGYRLIVSEVENGWAKVRASRFEGYVSAEYLEME